MNDPTVNAYRFPPGLQRNLLWTLLRRMRPGDPIEFFTDLKTRFGDIAHYKIGYEHIVFVNDPELIKEVLVNQATNFTKERTQDRMKILLGEGLITSEYPFHRIQRHLAQPAFHRQRIYSYGAVMVEKALRVHGAWSRSFVKAERDGKPLTLDIAREMMHLTLSIVGKTLFGSDVDSESEEIAAEVNSIMSLYNFLVMLPKAEHLLDWPIPGLVRFRRARKRLNDTVYRMVREHRESGVDTGDLLSMLLAARYDDGSQMSDKQLRDEVLTIFLAGYGTAANALTWTWYLLSQNPQSLAKLHSEVDQVLNGRVATVEDLPRLKYTEMVISESMRLYPPAWVMGRKAKEDFTFGGYRLPAKTSVFFSQYIMHRNPLYFADPLRFDPERFTLDRKAALPKFAYFPFGGGNRQCIGEGFAWMELALVIATLAQKWNLELLPGHPVVPQPLITLRPKHGMIMTLTPR